LDNGALRALIARVEILRTAMKQASYTDATKSDMRRPPLHGAAGRLDLGLSMWLP
jgi:hypothetical protein